MLQRVERQETEVVPMAKRRTFPVKYKREIVQEADACTQSGETGALLRRAGLYSSHLTVWRADNRSARRARPQDWRMPESSCASSSTGTTIATGTTRSRCSLRMTCTTASLPSASPSGHTVLDAAYAAHPERFVRGAPVRGAPPKEVWINPPKAPTETQKPQA